MESLGEDVEQSSWDGRLVCAGPQRSEDKILGGSSGRDRSVPFFYQKVVLPRAG